MRPGERLRTPHLRGHDRGHTRRHASCASIHLLSTLVPQRRPLPKGSRQHLDPSASSPLSTLSASRREQPRVLAHPRPLASIRRRRIERRLNRRKQLNAPILRREQRLRSADALSSRLSPSRSILPSIRDPEESPISDRHERALKSWFKLSSPSPAACAEGGCFRARTGQYQPPSHRVPKDRSRRSEHQPEPAPRCESAAAPPKECDLQTDRVDGSPSCATPSS